MPVYRPLIAMDKQDIVSIAEKIDTYETSILPYEDCCTIFTPQKPTTKPSGKKILKFEAGLEIDDLVQKAIEEAELIIVKRNTEEKESFL